MTNQKPPLFLNEDCDHFVYSRTPEELTPAGVDALVDGYAEDTLMTDLVFNPNASRSAIRSKIKQALWDGFDPSLGDDQPYFAGTREGHAGIRRVNEHFLLIEERGIDLYRRWIDRSRALGRRAWLSIRMNDFHNVDEVNHAQIDRLWKEHPEYWRVPWREFEWPADRALDYGHREVLDHHVNYAKECIARYDFDGLELDWMRQPWCFRPGREREGLAISDEIVTELRNALDDRAKEVGHPIKLSVRVPSRPDAARRFGFDAPGWARRGLVDVVIPSPDFGTTEFDMPIEIWQQLLEGTGAILTPALEITLLPFPFAPFGIHTIETARGAAAGFLERGAHGIYLFNFMDAPASHPLGVDGLRTILKEVGSLDTLANKPRRHVVTFASPRYPGEPYNAALPYRLGKYGYRPSAEFRVVTGPVPTPGQEALVRIGLQADEEPGHMEGNPTSVTAYGRQIAYSSLPVDPSVARELRVYIDGVLCPFAGEISRDGDNNSGPTHSYRIPPGALQAGENVVELGNLSETTALVVWVEVKVE